MDLILKNAADDFNATFVEKYKVDSAKECIELCLLLSSQIYGESKESIFEKFKTVDSYVQYNECVKNEWVELFGSDNIRSKDFVKRIRKILKSTNKSQILCLRCMLAMDGLRKGDESKYAENVNVNHPYTNFIREQYNVLRENEPNEATAIIKNTIFEALRTNHPLFSDLEVDDQNLLSCNLEELCALVSEFYTDKFLKRLKQDLKKSPQKKRKNESSDEDETPTKQIKPDDYEPSDEE